MPRRPALRSIAGAGRPRFSAGSAPAVDRERVVYRRPSLRAVRVAIALLLSLVLAIEPAAAQSVLRDAETEALFADMTRPLAVAAGLDPNNLKVSLIQDPEINAFVAGGQTVYINSGLLMKAENANEIQGVIAHEMGHIVGGHVIRNGEGARPATRITILSLLLGAAAIAAGAGEAGMGIMGLGQNVAMTNYLAFSRTQESSADAAGASYLVKAGVTGKGMLSFFKKLQQMEYRITVPGEDSFATTHPLTGDRIANLQKTLEGAPSWNTPADPKLNARFLRVKAKLTGYVEDPPVVLRDYPETDLSVPGHYARAYAYHRGAYPQKAVEEADSLLRTAPHDPYFLELKGQILLESGKPAEAIAPLREAVERSNNEPLIATTFGHALIATEDPANFEEARRVLKISVARDDENPFAWYQLGVIYTHDGDEARAAMATAERYSLEGNKTLARVNAEFAVRGLPTGSPDFLRAQDIAMVSDDGNGRKKKH